MYKDEVVGYVNYNYQTQKLIAEVYSDNIAKAPWVKGLEVDPEYIMDFLEDRCFPRSRANADELLRAMGLTQYIPFDIIKVTHGLMMHDYYWIKFEGEDVNYEDIKIRD